MAKVNEYRRAIRAVAKTGSVSLAGAAYSVIQAKLVYKIGARLHSLFSLIEVESARWPEYKVDQPSRQRLRELNPPWERKIVDDKPMFRDHCNAHGIPSIMTVCDMDSRNRDGRTMSREQWCAAIEGIHDRVFIKLIDGSGGEDSFVAQRENGRWAYCGCSGSIESLHDFCQKRRGDRRGWMVQPVLRNSVQMHDITSSNALATLRVVTCLDPGGPSILYAALKLVVGDNVTDNFSHGLSGNLIVPMDIQTGKLGPARGSLDRDWPRIVSFDKHPETQATITGFTVPFWNESKALLLRAQTTLPQLRTLGWDLAITDDGPVVVEANANYDMDLLQVALRRGLKSELLERLERVDRPLEEPERESIDDLNSIKIKETW